MAREYLFEDPAETAFLDRLDPGSTTSENPLETLIAGKLLAPQGRGTAGSGGRAGGEAVGDDGQEAGLLGFGEAGAGDGL